ncbi:MAG: Sec-independent protein translocase protein TatB [Byssovorax sp.]
MFGLSLGEIVLLLIVGIVVVGPKNLPTMMRTAGQWVSKLRRMSVDLRSQSGIDELIRIEGLEKEIQELRALSRMNVVESLIAPGALQPLTRNPIPSALPSPGAVPRGGAIYGDHVQPLREREYPLAGCDAGGALPDDAVIYHHAEPEPEAKAVTESSSTKPEPESSSTKNDATASGEPAAPLSPGEPEGSAGNPPPGEAAA